ncbi:response regulator [Candidatus Thiodictyon syntrophicum]|jgi:two-component system response regulator QseB|uniref:DNA-binding response regulator n=1 Tax=Candidatus Thiodictyon syntrophicum TaxID=1166950 RepID=A0A2K8U7G3_9GAMM|nr:response regulator [Candidatus Thiodictyon syntrophicum]AUB81530.1 DNA-binding response regulator [Candidatus Thiodictyon syntrophicum]
MRVLIVEDDPLLGPGLKTGLAQDGFAADWVQAAEPALHALSLEHFDVLVLDLGLPGRDGLSLLRELRRAGSVLPILILTARDALADKVGGLDAGADDYLVKPFDLDELSARLRALVRRSGGHPAPLLCAGDLTLDLAQRAATQGGQPLTLSPREFALLEVLMTTPDRVVARTRLDASTCGWHGDSEGNSLEVHIHNLRRKLGPGRILTVRGVGYRLVCDPVP